MITMRQFAAGESIIKENEPGETAFVIERGKVEVTKVVDGKSVHIAFLEKGSTFGEMSMVDDLPRSASVKAVEETLVRELHRDDLYATMKSSPDTVITLLKSIFERLREANGQIARLTSEASSGSETHIIERAPKNAAIPGAPAAAAAPAAKNPATPVQPSPGADNGPAYCLEALTPRAKETLASNPMPIRAFPFKIGRRSQDPLVSNHLAIDDEAPLQVSRHHVSIIREGNRIGIADRGSQLGASVDGVRIGGRNGPGPIFLKGEGGVLVLGGDTSPYKYRIRPAT